jgi:hypothetical protein
MRHLQTSSMAMPHGGSTFLILCAFALCALAGRVKTTRTFFTPGGFQPAGLNPKRLCIQKEALCGTLPATNLARDLPHEGNKS